MELKISRTIKYHIKLKGCHSMLCKSIRRRRPTKLNHNTQLQSIVDIQLRNKNINETLHGTTSLVNKTVTWTNFYEWRVLECSNCILRRTRASFSVVNTPPLLRTKSYDQGYDYSLIETWPLTRALANVFNMFFCYYHFLTCKQQRIINYW